MARKSFPKLVRVSSPTISLSGGQGLSRPVCLGRGEFLLSSLGLIEVFGAIAYSSIRSEDLIEDLYQVQKSPESLPILSERREQRTKEEAEP